MAVPRGARITGDQRATMARELGERYAAGESIRALADSTGRSYGFVQALIRESGVSVRSRGGAVARPAGSTQRSAARSTGSGSGREGGRRAPGR
ncbi:helix-turn-helix domain-containing protein, partial [Desertihabitans aurantiacus]|uniref:helix-turn-helix domain-containing protein n=1 Tax=Desertihabitans aurantiacus TaxID=2282477 RepID=UPI001E35102A